jgi:hypothetical protein
MCINGQVQQEPPKLESEEVNRSSHDHFFWIHRIKLGYLANFHSKQTLPANNFGVQR